MTGGKHDQRAGGDEAKAPPVSRRALGRVPRLALSGLVVATFGAIAGLATFAAYSDTTSNSGNVVQAGTVDIDDNDNGFAMLSITNANPATSDTACITVTTNGTLDSAVRLYGTTTGSGLDPYVDLVVTRGTGTVDVDCNGFSADATNYIAQGAGVVYSGTLQAFPDDWTGGLVDPLAATPETWSTGESHVYKFVATVQNVNAAQDLDASQVFIWEARNL
jgi:hypothetical protein